jgi:hypothetical protein
LAQTPLPGQGSLIGKGEVGRGREGSKKKVLLVFLSNERVGEPKPSNQFEGEGMGAGPPFVHVPRGLVFPHKCVGNED